MKPALFDCLRTENPQDLLFIGFALSSFWSNGHAVIYRGLLQALHERGHRIQFLERETPVFAAHRDLPEPDFCTLSIYRDLDDLKRRFGPAVRKADAVIVGSSVPEGAEILAWARRQTRGPLAFYDLDTPFTLESLEGEDDACLSRANLEQLDLYLSCSGGRALSILGHHFGVARVRHLPGAVDHRRFRPMNLPKPYLLGYLGTYREDRHPALERFLLHAAREFSDQRFVVAGARYPEGTRWPRNIDRIATPWPRDQPAFYAGQRFTLNLTRDPMRRLGYSPGIRLFEAAACGSVIISDIWDGIAAYFTPDKEILLCRGEEEVRQRLSAISEEALLEIGQAARERILREHTFLHRAIYLERFLAEARVETAGALLPEDEEVNTVTFEQAPERPSTYATETFPSISPRLR
jgi:spore maturation protein CgeB